MAIYSSNGVKVSIGTTAAASTNSEYAADAYVVIGEVESIEAFGDKQEIVTFNSITDGRVRKAKGVADAGDFTLTMAHDPADAGQVALKAAQLSKDAFNFKIELADKPATGTSPTNSVKYFKGLVSSVKTEIGTGNDITKLKAVIAIGSEILGTVASSS